MVKIPLASFRSDFHFGENTVLDQNLSLLLMYSLLYQETVLLGVRVLRTCTSIISRRRELGRDGKILSGHRQDGNVEVGGIGNLAR